jgi:hypothetical protein
MSTFFGQVPTTQMLLPSVDTSEMRRELRQLDVAIEDWKRRNPPPSIGSDDYSTWSGRFDRQMGDKVLRARYLRNQINVTPLVQAASELNVGEDRSPRGQFAKAKAAYDRGDGEGPLEDLLTANYNRAYYRYLYAGDRDYDNREYESWLQRDSFGYGATLLNLKPDPMGRFLLCDIRTREDLEYSILCLAGGAPLALGTSHPDTSEDCYPGYLRMHSDRPGGARVRDMGLGSTLYVGTMVTASMFGGFKGIFSMDGGCGSIRKPDADALWARLVEYGLAQEGESEDPYGGGSDPDDEPEDEDYTGYSDDYPGEGGGEPVQYMDTRRLMKHPAIAFTCSGNGGLLPPHHKSSWKEQAKGDRPAGTPRYGGAATRRRSMQLSDDILAAHWKDSSTPKVADRRTVEMLAAAMHGTSPMLVVFIAEAIKNSKHPKAEDLTVAYLTRPDIASMVQGNQRVMELLGQQRLPGLGGLSRAALRDVMDVMRLGRSPGIGDNPLHLPKQSAEVKRLIAQYPEF